MDLYNRAGGFSAVDYKIVPDLDSVAVIRGTSKKQGLKIRYQELPYEWHQPHYVYAEMFFETEPFRYMRIRGEHLEKKPAVRYSIYYVPGIVLELAGWLHGAH